MGRMGVASKLFAPAARSDSAYSASGMAYALCERCQDESKCEVKPTEKLDQVAMLIEIGLHDPNPKLRGN